MPATSSSTTRRVTFPPPERKPTAEAPIPTCAVPLPNLTVTTTNRTNEAIDLCLALNNAIARLPPGTLPATSPLAGTLALDGVDTGVNLTCKLSMRITSPQHGMVSGGTIALAPVTLDHCAEAVIESILLKLGTSALSQAPAAPAQPTNTPPPTAPWP